jgi:hypothetical protein
MEMIIKMTREFEEREAAVLLAALQEETPLDHLLPFNQVGITTSAHKKNIAIGTVLDSLSAGKYEWYGYSLAERMRPQLIVDTLLQQGQFVTGVDVNFKPNDAAKSLDELVRINREEEREGTPHELMVVGIVHRHPFTSGIPRRSEKDVINLSNFIHWLGTTNMDLSKYKDMFEELGPITPKIEGFELVLYPESADYLTLRYDLGDLHAEADFIMGLREEGVFNETNLARIGGFRELLRRHLDFRGVICAEQGLYVATATSLIYNELGDQTFGEIQLLARGSINNEYEKPFEVPVEVITDLSAQGRYWDENTLEHEINQKVYWSTKRRIAVSGSKPRIIVPGKKALVGVENPDLTNWPSNIPIVGVQKDDSLDEEDITIGFYHAAGAYLANYKLQDVKYSTYLFMILQTVMDKDVKNLRDAVKKIGSLFEDPINLQGEIPRPYLRGEDQEYMIMKLECDLTTHDTDFMIKSQKGTCEFNLSLEQYVGQVLAK